MEHQELPGYAHVELICVRTQSGQLFQGVGGQQQADVPGGFVVALGGDQAPAVVAHSLQPFPGEHQVYAAHQGFVLVLRCGEHGLPGHGRDAGQLYRVLRERELYFGEFASLPDAPAVDGLPAAQCEHAGSRPAAQLRRLAGHQPQHPRQQLGVHHQRVIFSNGTNQLLLQGSLNVGGSEGECTRGGVSL